MAQIHCKETLLALFGTFSDVIKQAMEAKGYWEASVVKKISDKQNPDIRKKCDHLSSRAGALGDWCTTVSRVQIYMAF